LAPNDNGHQQSTT